MVKIERADFVCDEHLEYLDELRESGETNMYGARAYLLKTFPELNEQDAGDIFGYWKQTFGKDNR